MSALSDTKFIKHSGAAELIMNDISELMITEKDKLHPQIVVAMTGRAQVHATLALAYATRSVADQ